MKKTGTATALVALALACGPGEETTRERPTHQDAATKAEEAAGMNPGAFGPIAHVYSYFMRCTGRLTLFTGVGEQKRCYDYGVAMLTYFELNPVGDLED